jgi:hypothetical protein
MQQSKTGLHAGTSTQGLATSCPLSPETLYAQTHSAAYWTCKIHMYQITHPTNNTRTDPKSTVASRVLILNGANGLLLFANSGTMPCRTQYSLVCS